MERRDELMDAPEAGLGCGNDLFIAQVRDEILKAAKQTSNQSIDYICFVDKKIRTYQNKVNELWFFYENKSRI